MCRVRFLPDDSIIAETGKNGRGLSSNLHFRTLHKLRVLENPRGIFQRMRLPRSAHKTRDAGLPRNRMISIFYFLLSVQGLISFTRLVVVLQVVPVPHALHDLFNGIN